MRSKRFTAAVALVVIASFGMAPMANAATRPTTAQKLQLQYLVAVSYTHLTLPTNREV